jgi:hypothetical protein
MSKTIDDLKAEEKQLKERASELRKAIKEAETNDKSDAEIKVWDRVIEARKSISDLTEKQMARKYARMPMYVDPKNMKNKAYDDGKDQKEWVTKYFEMGGKEEDLKEGVTKWRRNWIKTNLLTKKRRKKKDDDGSSTASKKAGKKASTIDAATTGRNEN